MSSPSIRLVEYLACIGNASLDGKTAECATLALLDNIGCGVYGARQPWGCILSSLVAGERSEGNATVFGSVTPTAPVHAALANGTATHGFELDDIILGSLVHPGAVTVPAALAAAEQHGASGERLLSGLVTGYEMMGRLGLALGPQHNDRGYHTTGVAGPVAAAIAAGIVMELSVPQLLSAIGIACSSACGIKAFTQGTGGMVKRMHAGRAAEAGVLACELAERGFTGPQHAIDGRFGLLEVISGADARPQELDRDLGSSLAIRRVWVKAYPCCGFIHSVVHALESLRKEHGPAPQDIQSVRVGTNRHAVEHNGEQEPRETMAAQYSIPFCSGVALAANPRDPKAYGEAGLRSADVRALAAKTALAVDTEMDRVYPAHNAARVRIELNDGRTFERTVIDPPGTPNAPCSRVEIEAKFRLSAGAVKTSENVDRIIAAVDELYSQRSLAQLSQELRSISCD